MFKQNGYKHTRDSVLEQIDNIKYKCQLPPIAHYKYLNNLQEVSPKKIRTRAVSESGEQSQKIVSLQQEREIYIKFLEILNQKNYITSGNWQQLIDHHFQTLKQEEDYVNEIKRYKNENCFKVKMPKMKRRKY